MEEQFVTLEIAQKLKELGMQPHEYRVFAMFIKCNEHYFDDPRSGDRIFFNEGSPVVFSLTGSGMSEYQEHICWAPLWQQAFDFVLSKIVDYRITTFKDGSGYFEVRGIERELPFLNREDLLTQLIGAIEF